MPSSIEKFSSLNELDVTACNFSGMIPTSIGKLTQLTYLDLSENNLVGKIPSSLGNLTQLIQLWLSNNHLSGLVPLSFSKLTSLQLLTLKNNNLTGTVNFDMFFGLKALQGLDLSDNKLSVVIKHSMNDTVPQFTQLFLSNCNLRKFPDFLQYQERIVFLELIGNYISGQIPEWLFNKSKETFFLLQLSENNLSGKIPPAICNLSSIAVLRMSFNNLEGNLPQCFGNMKSLSVLTLKNNSFSGNLPIFSKGNKLKLIDFSENQLQGKLPPSLANCRDIGYLNLEYNQLNDVFPFWLGSLPELEVLMLRSNRFHGVIGEPIPDYEFPKLCIIDMSFNNFSGKLPSKYSQSWKALRNSISRNLTYMKTKTISVNGSVRFRVTTKIKGVNLFYEKIPDTIAIINLSDNNFDGQIPEDIGNVEALFSLDLANNNLNGGIPALLGNLRNLESLDLSQNDLSGEIPLELAKLTFLQYFNVSYNHLTGPIPQTNQLSRFESSSYENNLGLCGIPLPNKCGNSEAFEPPHSSFEEETSSSSFFQFG
ncbi:receptor-like protein 19 [Humulus lupulus]|uniref:receptor-like protein 19 n=1 Tax=Humulus lupulus TaxID=3486 RepID=UPI002B411419|nr:receptor-like protein 19 [Humulus lupulus]